jgi:hypothetical protein
MEVMGEDPLEYARLVREALLDVPRRALRLAAREGLPGDHHFYVSFRTTHPGVSLSSSLRARHPEEMTVVLQHQYWDLAVGDDAFSVTLRFGGVPERLHVPFASLTAFADPAAEFGLRFDHPGEARVIQEPGKEPTTGEEAADEGGPRPRNVVDIRAFRRPEERSREEEEPEPAG